MKKQHRTKWLVIALITLFSFSFTQAKSQTVNNSNTYAVTETLASPPIVSDSILGKCGATAVGGSLLKKAKSKNKTEEIPFTIEDTKEERPKKEEKKDQEKTDLIHQ